ncbi:MAG: helix-turn-helix domain-containing protein [Phycisphaera sp.]|nr:helix-turn-helix domain-containing protein [Phycisphaera sp.]
MSPTAKSMTANDTERYHVPNLERALQIIEHLAEHATPMGVTELSEQLGFPKNSVFRIVSTLHAHGYLNRDDASKQYTLGSKLLSIGYAAVQEGHLIEKSLDVMRAVRDETDETVLIGILDGTEGVVLEQVLPMQQLKVTVGIGARFPLHTAAPGKAMIAHLPESELNHLLDRIEYPRFTDTTITSKRQMLEELGRVRDMGFALDNGEHNPTIRCVSAAVLDQRGHPAGAIWVTGPEFRITDDRFEPVGHILRDAAARISRRFGYDG